MRRALSLVIAFGLLALLPMTTNAQRRRSQPRAAAPGAAQSKQEVLLPSRSPLITFRLMFMTGSADDPSGKEGVAALTASMLAQGGSRG